MVNVKLAGDLVYGKLLFTWLSLVMSLMVSFCVVLFYPRDVLDEIGDLIESVSWGFPTYFCCLVYTDYNAPCKILSKGCVLRP